ncbi:MAG: TIGR00341 family protein [Candidatus Kapaibacterium sp.]|jgi:uncharacterized hydrophobic protein (TIGR00271 family)|nr:TIGR00341 family protein [Candidatus Kapabacteria bacterium]
MKYTIKFIWQDVRRYLWQITHDVVSIKEGTDEFGTIASIRSGIPIRGANVWILICSALLASIGLDVNSTAVIIGAMLISPLMTPILGIGLGFGISDRDMIFSSIKNFSFAVFVSLIAASVYFVFTPLGQATPELLARTKPTLLDVGVAIFGGIAGIVATSRHEKTSAIPGVAIATALMPPLCTAGYGIASGEIQFFFGAFYLFMINAFFISLSTYFVVRYLNFPYIKFIDDERKKKMQRSILIVAIVLILPSSYILYDVVVDARIQRNVQSFIDKYINNPFHEAIRWEIEETDSTGIVKIFIVGESLDNKQVNRLEREFNKWYIDDHKLKLIQMNVPPSERIQLKKELAGEVALSVIKQMQSAQSEKQVHQRKIDSLQKVMRELYLNHALLNDIKEETSVLFPEIDNLRFGLLGSELGDNDSSNVQPVAYIIFKNNVRAQMRKEISGKISNYLQVKFKRDSVMILQD